LPGRQHVVGKRVPTTGLLLSASALPSRAARRSTQTPSSSPSPSTPHVQATQIPGGWTSTSAAGRPGLVRAQLARLAGGGFSGRSRAVRTIPGRPGSPRSSSRRAVLLFFFCRPPERFVRHPLYGVVTAQVHAVTGGCSGLVASTGHSERRSSPPLTVKPACRAAFHGRREPGPPLRQKCAGSFGRKSRRAKARLKLECGDTVVFFATVWDTV